MAKTKVDRTALVALLNAAHKAGMDAGDGVTPRPMVVRGGVPGGDTKTYVVDDGMCGFAWVTVRPANSALARVMKDTMGASTAYHGGMQLWVHQFNQSVARKEAYASAFAKVLQVAGYDAVAGSRLD